ncbi:hypothetical protein [Vreelandella subglaciescola]|jgi:hypothetical protein|uniref:Uncharacterized protein n=1 Tax=Vreelandella subglaciescola TaxID=29571 RepID=A0A1M7EL76_9GAMM|nr:hypothetical protein [Halomonas subglaciescola]SHL92428.1 hypothetical protein SAMN05878437_0287 [Halomonas subglaciescola]
MHNVRRYADVVAGLEGLMWLGLGWSISLSVYQGSSEPTLAAVLLIGTVTFFSWVHRPLRFLLRRYHVRKRRTDMWVHLLALPLLLAMALYLIFDAIFGGAWLPPKMLVVNVLASAGWLTFMVTLFIRFLIHGVKNNGFKNSSAKNNSSKSNGSQDNSTS